MKNKSKERVKVRRVPDVALNTLDRVIGFISPVRAARRYRARLSLAIAGGYIGGSRSRRSLKEWNPLGYDADTDILPDLPALRERSRDLIRNNPLAAGAINTKVTNVVGTGLRLQSRIDRGVLNMTEDQANAWEDRAEREWRLFWDTKECDAARTLTGNALTSLVYRQAKENGDVFVVMPRIKRKGCAYDLKMQVVEADRVCNKDDTLDTETLAGGIQKDKYGAPVSYHILKQHPGVLMHAKSREWQEVPAFGRILGFRNVIHLFKTVRPNQSRGVPDLAPVIEPLKQLGRYTDAELDAAVISSFFTVFIETESGDTPLDLTDLSGETGSKTTDDDYKLASGAIIGLAKGEKIHDTNPGRPNDSFDPFVMAILRKIGVALELPFEILIKHFTKSYSAARAALLEAWKYFITERQWLADDFNRLIYEVWMAEAVSKGRIAAPGFFTDPLIRHAYLGSEWVGPAKGQIDEKKEVEAAQMAVDMGISTLAEKTAEMTGGDWEKKHPQSVKEHNARKDAGLLRDKERENSKEKIEEREDDEGD